MKLLLFAILFALSVSVQADSDLEILIGCFQADLIDECAKADFNGDGVINVLDFAEFRTATEFDLNSDGVVDFSVDDDD